MGLEISVEVVLEILLYILIGVGTLGVLGTVGYIFIQVREVRRRKKLVGQIVVPTAKCIKNRAREKPPEGMYGQITTVYDDGDVSVLWTPRWYGYSGIYFSEEELTPVPRPTKTEMEALL